MLEGSIHLLHGLRSRPRSPRPAVPIAAPPGAELLEIITPPGLERQRMMKWALGSMMCMFCGTKEMACR